ncbi:helix-turn-helix domain-containing protein [Haladaptatus caseinilyticus]|uniref:helix-turn-helix domain-containing protein n=1 Tax=Haladaptatus caseinilyticus TaxID=2993314 RepID=UPI00224B25AC|nr:helix-turn-helix domain-containing protein [Haladaptatus caseinilyticus]
MTFISHVTVHHPKLALTPTIEAVPTVTIKVVPTSGTDPETGMFFFLVESETGEFESFEDALDEDGTVEESEKVADHGDTRIYRICYTPETKLLTPKTTEVGGLMLEAETVRQGWLLRLQLPDRESLSRLWDYCREEDISFELDRLYQQESLTADGKALTDAQRRTLLRAFEAGYFEEPRQTSHKLLAEQLDISATAVGGRIRRGTARLIETTLVSDE